MVPVHLDALFLQKPDTVLQSTADFSRIPYRDKDSRLSVNADVGYSSEEIVAPPFRGKSLRLGAGVHLHWAMPDALTQGVRLGKRLDFPALPDRWLVSRRNRASGETERSWIVESDYLYPERALEEDTPPNTVTFPLPPVPFSSHGQPYRYLGRNWRADESAGHWPKDLENADYLNTLAEQYASDPESKAAVQVGLTAMGYGDPTFAAFYPNCRSVYGFHDTDITTPDAFAKVSYDLVGWYDQPEDRDILRASKADEKTPLELTVAAQALKRRKEHLASGHKPQEDDPDENWRDAVSHLLGWAIAKPEGEQQSPAKRLICYGTLRTHAEADFVTDPAEVQGEVQLAIGNTASEALSAALAQTVPGNPALIEEQLEALDLGQKFSHRRLDIGPKFKEARHDRGFRAISGGHQFAIRHEGAPSESEDTQVKTPVEMVLPEFLHHTLNQLNEAQRAMEVAEEEIASLRGQIFRDWSLFMTSLRPPPGLEHDYPDPIEVMRFTEKTGLAQLRASLAAKGGPVTLERGDDSTSSADAPITCAQVPDDTDKAARSAKVARLINEVVKGLDVANQLLALIRRLDRIDAAMKTEAPKAKFPILEATIPFSGYIRSLDFSPDGAHILVAADDSECGLFDTLTGKAKFTLPDFVDNVRSVRFDKAGDKIVINGLYISGVIDPKTGALLNRLTGNGDNIIQALFTHDGAKIIGSCWDQSLCVWETKNGNQSFRFALENGVIEKLAIDAETTMVAAGSSLDNIENKNVDAILTIVEIKSEKHHSFKAGNGKIKTLQFDPDGKKILVVSASSAGIYKPESGTLEIKLDSSDHVVKAGCLSHDGKLVATGAKDGTIKIWDLANEAKVITTAKLPSGVAAIAFSPDSTQLLTTGEKGAAKIWDVQTGQLLHDLTSEGDEYCYLAIFDPTGKRVAVGDFTSQKIRVWRLETPSFKEKYGFDIDLSDDESTAEELRRDIFDDFANDCVDIEEMQDGCKAVSDLFLDTTDHVAQTPPSVPTHFTLRQIDAPRFYQPNDPVVLITGDDVKPTPRHGTDGSDRDDGKLACHILEIEPLKPLKDWADAMIPPALEIVREFVRKRATEEEGATPTQDRPGLRDWREQPWHPFAMEWQVEVQPDSEGSNRSDAHSTYTSDFVTKNYSLPELGVDLEPRTPGTKKPTADSGLYDGSTILVDHASGLMLAKLNAFLDPDKAEEEKTPQQRSNEETLRAVRDHLAQRPASLSQSLDGLHEAFLQRHQILQLPIADPIGPTDLGSFTELVRKATTGRHGNAPLRDRDFTPIRSGTMHLRQLRLIDTFGRVKSLHKPNSKTPLTVAETLAVPGNQSAVALRPRLVQPARVNLRWLSAQHADGKRTDEPEVNAHPAMTPVCGWILPDVLNSILSIHDTEGASLGSITSVDGRVQWQSAPGDLDPIETLDTPNPRLNEHLGTLLRTIISDIDPKDPTFFPSFINAIGNALETIAPEDFSAHRSLALLTSRPVAVVRAMVNLEIKGRPATNESVASAINDMAAAVDPSRRNDPARSRRPRILVAPVDRQNFESALDRKDFDALELTFNNGGIDLPTDHSYITLVKESHDPLDPRWRIDLPVHSFHIAREGESLRVSDDFSRTTDGFCDVRFPIRIGESQQLNDGLIGYFVEEFHTDAYRYRDNHFFAPQGAGRIVLEPGITAPDLNYLTDQLDVGIVPPEVGVRLEGAGNLDVTVEKSGHRWRLDTPGRVYSLVLGPTEIEVAQIISLDSAHLSTHWKSPVNIEHSLDAPPLKLTMLVDPQGSVHAVSGILPTKAITIPTEFYAKALRNIEIALPASPVVTDVDALYVPSWTQEGFDLTWLTRDGQAWRETAETKPVETRAQFANRQQIVEGWLKLKKKKETDS